MSAPNWMPLYVSDYLTDTRHLSTTEHGAYLLLLMHAWVNEGRLPLDETRLARIAGLDAKEWKASREVLLAYFDKCADCYRHSRVDSELEKAAEVIEKRRRAGQVSASKRQQSANTCSTHVGTHAPTESQQSANQPQPQSHSPTEMIGCLDAREPDAEPVEGEIIPSSADDLTEYCAKKAGVSLASPGKYTVAFDLVSGWIKSGCDPGLDIMPTIQRLTASSDEPISSLKYFDKAIRHAHVQRTAAATGVAKPRANARADTRPSRLETAADAADRALAMLGKRAASGSK